MNGKLSKYRLLLKCMIVGLLTGFLIAFFRVSIIKADEIREHLLKLAHSSLSGGIFLPLLVLGAIIGGIISGIATEAMGVSSIYAANFVVIAMAGMFASIVRAPVTGIVLISEMSGGLTSMLALVIVSMVAYITSDMLRGEPIYDRLLRRRQLAKKEFN